MWITPKLDWTSDDYYNFEDLNRVERNTEAVAKLIGNFIVLPPLTFIADRDMKRIEFASSLNRIESNQNELRQRFTPIRWMENKLDWESNTPFSNKDAQRLEHNLNLLYRHYKGNSELIPFCGVFTCGEELI